MPAERRPVRSNKSDGASSTNDKKSHSRKTSSSSTTSKDRPVPTRSTSSRSKSISKTKGGISAAKDMSGDKKTQVNGTDQLENGIEEQEDVEMKQDDLKKVGKAMVGKDKNGDEEMTVVVPPSKSEQIGGASSNGQDEDAVMNGTGEEGTEVASGVVVDHQANAVSSKFDHGKWVRKVAPTNPYALQASSRILRYLSVQYHNSILGLHYECCDPYPQSENI